MFHVIVIVLLVLVLVALVARGAWSSVRFACLPRHHKAHLPHMIRARVTWRWFCRNVNPPLAIHDKHRPRATAMGLRGHTGVRVRRRETDPHETVRYPRARWRVTATGWTAEVRTIPHVGRVQIEAAAPHIRDAWRVQRVAVSQVKPGRVLVTGHREDPLLTPYEFTVSPAAPAVLRHLGLGRDEHGKHRTADLANCPGIVVGGMPGSGKSTEITAWLAQLAPSPAAQFALVDGKGASEFADFAPRAYLMAGDDLDDALELLEHQHFVMTARLGIVREVLGVKNAWHVGMSADWPLVVTVLDECQSLLDLTAVKGSRDLDAKVRRAIFLTSSLVRRGRSVGMLTIPATQKPTTDSVPSSIRDNCPLSLCFGVKTPDAAVATLGGAIRDHDSFSPVAFADPAYAGCATATLRTGQDPFTRIRGPLITEHQAAAVASATAHLRKDPRDLLPALRSAPSAAGVA